MRSIQFAFILLVLFSISRAETNTQNDQDKVDESSKNYYTKYFREKRIQQQTAVKRIVELKDGKKQMEMIKPVVNKLFEVLFSTIERLAKVQTENRDHDSLKVDKEIANDISVLLENTAFAADIALHLPKFFHKLYNKNKNWKMILESAIVISKRSNLLDNETQQALDLMSQELGITPRSENYHNPYKNDPKKEMQEPHQILMQKNPKKIKRPRGPGLSGGIKYEL